MTRVIILAGAPESARLDWSEKTLLPVEHIETVSISQSTTSSFSNKPFTAQWRAVNTEKLQMRPIALKLNLPTSSRDGHDPSPAEFLSPDELVALESATSDASGDESQPSGGSADSISEAMSDFHRHSFAIHEAIPSTEMTQSTDVPPGTPTYESHEEMFPQTPGPGAGIIRSPSQRRLSQAPRPLHMSDLEDIPNASYLHSIIPQTMTVSLIVGILSIAPPRTVATGGRYGRPRQTELVELMVADNTKSGFNITMWLPREMHVNWKDGARAVPEGSRSALRRNLRMLRPRDVVLIQNVALSSYRDKVHGQSLKGDVTKIDLLYRKKLDDDDISGVYSASNLRNANGKDPQILKVKKVRDWMNNFVGEAPTTDRRRKGGIRKPGFYGLFPDDSQ